MLPFSGQKKITMAGESNDLLLVAAQDPRCCSSSAASLGMEERALQPPHPCHHAGSLRERARGTWLEKPSAEETSGCHQRKPTESPREAMHCFTVRQFEIHLCKPLQLGVWARKISI